MKIIKFKTVVTLLRKPKISCSMKGDTKICQYDAET